MRVASAGTLLLAASSAAAGATAAPLLAQLDLLGQLMSGFFSGPQKLLANSPVDYVIIGVFIWLTPCLDPR